jgi:hypothetical protein
MNPPPTVPVPFPRPSLLIPDVAVVTSRTSEWPSEKCPILRDSPLRSGDLVDP